MSKGNWGYLAFLAPYIEQENNKNLINPLFDFDQQTAEVREVLNTVPIAGFKCPSFSQIQPVNFALSDGSVQCIEEEIDIEPIGHLPAETWERSSLAAKPYVGVHGFNILQCSGVFKSDRDASHRCGSEETD